MWVIIIGLGMFGGTQNYTIASIGVAMFALGTLFSFITLPVEYDASNRALAWLRRKNMVSQQELVASKDALKVGSPNLWLQRLAHWQHSFIWHCVSISVVS